MSQAEPPKGSDLGSRESPACKHLREEVKGEDTGPTPTLSTLGWGRAVYGVLLSLGSRDSCLLNIPAGWVSLPHPTSKYASRDQKATFGERKGLRLAQAGDQET